QMGFNPGTPEYMSPEQARGREIDQRSDIYSLGIVFYEMLTGHVPFEDDGSGTSDYEIRRGHIELPVPPLSKFYPGISHELEKIVFKALEKNPDDRYQTAQQFLDIIEEFEQTGTAKITGRMPGARQTVAHSDRGTERQSASDAPTIAVSDTVLTDPNLPKTNTGTNNANNSPSRNQGVFFAKVRQKSREPQHGDSERPRLPLLIGSVIVGLISIGIIYRLITTPPVVQVVPAGMISI